MKTYKGIEYIVHPRMGSYCAYVRLPEGHEWSKYLSKKHWFSIRKGGPRHYHTGYDKVPLEVHGGVTFGEVVTKNTKKDYPQGFTEGAWVGWDYLHYGDYWQHSFDPEDRVWRVEEIDEECKRAIDQLLDYKENDPRANH